MALPKRLSGAFAVLAVLVLCTLWVVNCSGPRPIVKHMQLIAPRTQGGAYQAQALIYNDGPGHGEVNVTFRLRNIVSGQTVEATSKVALQSGETSLVSAALPAPSGSYALEVDARYPPG